MEDHRSFYGEVGRRILEARRRRRPKMTQDELAKLVRLSRTSITNVEKGRQKLLLHTLADIAAALDVDIASLLPGGGKRVGGQLEEKLKDMPRAEKAWVKTTVSAAEKGRSNIGT